MHDPPRPLPLRRAAPVEHQRLLHPDHNLPPRPDEPVLPGRLPVPGRCGAVGPAAVGVLPVPGGEEEPLWVRGADVGPGREVPRLEAADVDVGDDGSVGGGDPAVDPALEVVVDELLVGGAEAEAEGEVF